MTGEKNWEGQPSTASEHRTLGGRAWCHECHEYCYPTSNCDCCLEARGWERAWVRPDGVVVDVNGLRLEIVRLSK